MEEKSADELFAELGYKKVEDSRENSNCMYISFRRHLMFSTIIKIVFHYEAKRVTVENEFMSMQELQAINKKVEELRMDIMCEYCKDIVNKPIRSVNWNGNGLINITKTGNLYGKDDEVFIINYCPMCGRKLGE